MYKEFAQSPGGFTLKVYKEFAQSPGGFTLKVYKEFNLYTRQKIQQLKWYEENWCITRGKDEGV